MKYELTATSADCKSKQTFTVFTQEEKLIAIKQILRGDVICSDTNEAFSDVYFIASTVKVLEFK